MLDDAAPCTPERAEAELSNNNLGFLRYIGYSNLDPHYLDNVYGRSHVRCAGMKAIPYMAIVGQRS